jgi:S1-C subfamily serine protease
VRRAIQLSGQQLHFFEYPIEVETMYKTILRNLALFIPLALVSASAFADLPDFAQLVEKNAPAVVNVQATHNGDSTAQGEIDDQEVP